MGWMIYHHVPSDIRAEIVGLCSPHEVLQASKVGSTWYVAARLKGTEEVLAFVFLTQTRNGEWGYKDMDETMGPNEAKAPVGLLDLLTEPKNDYAARWRERCREWAARPRPKTGETWRLATPVRFGGIEVQTITKVDLPRRRGVWSHPAVGLLRLRPDQLVGAELIN